MVTQQEGSVQRQVYERAFREVPVSDAPEDFPSVNMMVAEGKVYSASPTSAKVEEVLEQIKQFYTNLQIQ